MLINGDISSLSSLHKDVSHGFNVSFSIIKKFHACIDSTRVFFIVWPSCTKTDSGINIKAIIIVVVANSCSGSFMLPGRNLRFDIEPFFVTFRL